MTDLEMKFKKNIPPSFYPSLGSSYTDNTNMASWIYNFEKNHLSDLDKYEIQKNQLITELVNQPLNITITINDYTIDEYGQYNFAINQFLDENTINFSIVIGSYIDETENEVINNNDSILLTIEYQPENSVIKIIPLDKNLDLKIISNVIRVEGKEYLSRNNYYYFLGFNIDNTSK